MHPLLRVASLCCSLLFVAPVAAGAGVTGIAGIVEGPVTLIRGSQRFVLPEGCPLQAEDIVETGPGSFVQVELADGVKVGLGGGSRWLLAPRWNGRDRPRSYLIEGWAKLVQPAEAPAAPLLTAPRLDTQAQGASWVLHATAQRHEVFVESGQVRLAERGGGKATLQARANEFVALPAGAKPVLAARPTAEFIAALPRPFQDPLPARAERFAGQKIGPRAGTDVTYDEVAPWLQAEPALRQPMLPRWRGRVAADKRFLAAVQAHLAAHPEWGPVVYPERYTYRHGSAASAPAHPASTPR